MFTDWNGPLEAAENLPLTPSADAQLAAAARTCARHAHDKDDLALLLDAVGLPRDTTLTPHHPLLPQPIGDPGMPKNPNAFEATALSMYYADKTQAEITEATGLSEDEVTALVNAQERQLDADEATTTPPAATVAHADALVKELLAWAGSHPLAGIRSRAERIAADLAELSERRDSEAAQREAEELVAKAKAELERAQERLRAAKAGTRTTSPSAASAPTPIRNGTGSGYSKEELAAIRSWARQNGYKVSSVGVVSKRVREAFAAAHRAPATKAG